ncbi:hypothetical protein A2635_04225 [Candidatus Peribacteria bacterium RIFCSPHIGHO2_01_FULL_51_9]|nr:MAG: hypothetical protein A2635_04225 [Candidatus Peribacteria bacterium RIFCSPHIGHO2_01_FULL_51_9]
MTDQIEEKPKAWFIPKQKRGVMYKSSRELLAIVFWAYLFIKVFVFDLDNFFFQLYSPDYQWLLHYKFLAIIGMIVLCLIFFGSRQVILWMLYVICYPFFILPFKFALLILKQQSWPLALAVINSLFSFFKSIKYKFIATSALIVSAVLILVRGEEILLWPSMIAMLLLLTITYARSLFFIFRPAAILEIHSEIVSKLSDIGKKSYSLDEEIKNLPTNQLSEKQVEKYVSSLQMAMLFNRGCYFFSKKLQDYQNSKFHFISYIFNLLVTIIGTITIFSFINYGLYKISSEHFIATNPTFFNFFYYSFRQFTFGSIPEIANHSTIATIFAIIEGLFALFTVTILVTLLFSLKSERYSTEIKKVADSIKQQGDTLSIFISQEYKMTPEQALKELERLKAGMLNFIYQLSKNLDD